MFNARSDEYLHGRYYKNYPTLENAAQNATSGLTFRYKSVSEMTREEAQLATNSEINSAMRTIETSFPLPWESGAYVLLGKGSLWMIKLISTGTARNAQAARYGKPMKKYTLTLVEVEEPLGLSV